MSALPGLYVWGAASLSRSAPPGRHGRSSPSCEVRAEPSMTHVGVLCPVTGGLFFGEVLSGVTEG